MAPSWKQRSNDLAKPATVGGDRATADQPATDSARFAEALAMNPLLAQSAAAMAAATAIGLSITGQFANAFFGALQGALETSNRRSGGEPDVRADVPAGTGAKAPAPEAAPIGTESPKARRKKAVASDVAQVPAKGRGKAQPKAATKPRSVRKIAVGNAADDLKQISGIGPKLEKMLNEQGVTLISQIAAWSEAEIEKFDQVLTLDGRIERDDWVGQARKLAE